MKGKFVVFIFLINSCFVFSQNINDQPFSNFLVSVNRALVINDMLEDPKAVGSPYMQKNYENADVHTTNGVFKGIKLKYNILQDIFIVNLDGRFISLEPNNYIKKIIIGGNNFVVRPIPNSKKPADFVIQSDTSSVALFSKKNILFKPEEATNPILATVNPASYMPRPDKYYLQIGSGPLVLIEKIKDFYQLFPNQEDEIKKIVKAENLNFKNEADLKRIVRICSKSL